MDPPSHTGLFAFIGVLFIACSTHDLDQEAHTGIAIHVCRLYRIMVL